MIKKLLQAVLFVAALAVPAISAAPSVQSLPMGIPDFCALDANCTKVDAGQSQTISSPVTVSTLGIHGAVTLSSTLTATQILVYADGSLTLTNGAQIVFADSPLDLQNDPEQWGHGLIVFGKFRATGTVKQPFCRASGDLVAGSAALCTGVGWLPSDQKFIADTRQVPDDDSYNANYALQTERVVSAPLAFDHRCARLADGTITNLCPHVANLTRGIVIRSANPNGVRGHMAFIGRADVKIIGVEVRDMGRTKAEPLDSFPGPTTNQVGRYAVHFHHYWGPVNPTNSGFQGEFTDSVIVDARKWPLAFHASHYLNIARNVIVGGAGLTGAGIAGEDGSETENIIDGNFVGEIRGAINPRNTGGPTTANGDCPGCGGECIWAVGFNSRYTNNVVTGCRNPVQGIVNGVGFKFSVPAAPYTTKAPKFRGADMSNPAETLDVIPQTQRLLEFRGNEAYGGMADCLTIWHLGTNAMDDTSTGESVAKDLTCWHANEGAVWLYPTSRLTVDGLRYVAQIDKYKEPSAILSGDYRLINLTVKNAEITAAHIGGGTDWIGVTTFQNVNGTFFGNAYGFPTPATPGTGAAYIANHPSTTVNISGGLIRAWPGQPLKTILMNHTTAQANNDPTKPYTVNVSNYQGTGQNFRVYFPEQATQNLYGGLAPSTATASKPEITGLVDNGVSPLPPSGPIVDWAFSTIPSGLTLRGSDVTFTNGEAVWNAKIPNPIFVFPFDPARGTFGDTATFPNTLQSGTYAIRMRLLPDALNLGQASSIGVVTFRPDPDQNVMSFPPRALEFRRDNVIDPIQVIATEGQPTPGPTGVTKQDKVRATIANPEQEHTYLVTWTPTTLTLYVDGVQKETITRITTDYGALAYKLMLAVQPSLIHAADRPFLQGGTRYFQLYDRVLNASEIAALTAAWQTPTIPPVNPCVTLPLKVTGIKWPSGQTGNKSGSWNSGTFTLTAAGFKWNPLRFEAVDSRGCTFTVNK